MMGIYPQPPQLPPYKVKVSEECAFPTDRLSSLLQLGSPQVPVTVPFPFLFGLGLRTWGPLSPRCFTDTCWFFYIVPSLQFIKSPLLRGPSDFWQTPNQDTIQKLAPP